MVKSSKAPIWEPSKSNTLNSKMSVFTKQIEEKFGLKFEHYPDLHRWSIENLELFWQELANFVDMQWKVPPTTILDYENGTRMANAKWFPGAELNFAENLLDHSLPFSVTAYLESGERTEYSKNQIKNLVAICAQSLKKEGVEKGDRVAGVVGNGIEAVVGMLATASLGAVWSSCSPDFGASGVLDRLSQIDPKVVFFTMGYTYNGKPFACEQVLASLKREMKGVKKFVEIGAGSEGSPDGWVHFTDFAATIRKDGSVPLSYTPVAFGDPLYIMFSSGTTGVPKCIVHSVGGTLLQHKKEHLLHCNIKEGSKLLYFTTCGWMMWNWMVSALSVGADLVLFDGSVSYPDLSTLWRILDKEKVTAFGASPKFFSACMQNDIIPREILQDTRRLETMLSTGSPLLPEHFHWVKEQVGENIHLASICGGTDIISCFILGNPNQAVYEGEIQCRGLGMAVESWDENAEPALGKKGELVCTKPFVSMPVGFWNDPAGEKYKKAYFEHYAHKDVWRHGDYIEINERGGVVVFGRSDATLNPGGVRIGTSEIYRCVEFFEEVVDSIAVGYDYEGDSMVILFVKLAEGQVFNEEMASKFKKGIRKELSPRHVPHTIFSVKDIPYTRSGKKLELAVTNAIHGREVKNKSAIANPESLEEFFSMSKRLKSEFFTS